MLQKRPFAVVRTARSDPATARSSATFAGVKKHVATPTTNTAAASNGIDGGATTSTASTPERTRSKTIIVRRKSHRSTKAPAGIPNTSQAAVEAAATNPTSAGEWLTAAAANGVAATSIPSPVTEAAVAAYRNRSPRIGPLWQTAAMGFLLEPVGVVESPLRDPDDAPRQGDEGAPDAWLVLDSAYAQAAATIRTGMDLMLLTWLDRADRTVQRVHPRGDAARPEEGVFTTRSPHRPNPIGLHRVTVLAVEGLRIKVKDLEALDGTPLVDIKPVLGADR